MSLSSSRLQTALDADILSKLQAAYPIDTNLRTADKVTIAAGQQALANSIGDPTGSDVISEIVNHAVVPSTVAVTSVGGVSTGSGTSGPGTGTATGTVT
jgi:hypothetical protein